MCLGANGVPGGCVGRDEGGDQDLQDPDMQDLSQPPCLPAAVPLRPGPLCLEVGAARMSKLSGEPARDLERSLPAVASLGSSLSHSQSLSSRFLPPPREKRRSISDVRRTFCLFVTFDLLFISLLWIIELNVSGGKAGGTGRTVGVAWASVIPSAVWEGCLRRQGAGGGLLISR